MGRVRCELRINGRTCWVLFDSGARNTYAIAEAVQGLPSWDDPHPEPVALGGKVHRIVRGCMLMGTIEGHWVKTHARILDDIGNDEKGRRIEILFGALAMQEWGIELDLKNERLDLSHYSKEFLEF